MSVMELMGTAAGLGLLAGLRLYATVLAVGLAIRFGWLSLSQDYEGLRVLGEWWVIGLAGAGFLAEFIADKIPWIDTVWDGVHTLIRPLAAALITIGALGSLDSSVTILAGLLAGGVALSSHAAKATARFAVNHSPEPVSNAVLSLAGDVAVPFGVWFVLEHPLLAGALALLFVVGVLVAIPLIWRILKRGVTAMRRPRPTAGGAYVQ